MRSVFMVHLLVTSSLFISGQPKQITTNTASYCTSTDQFCGVFVFNLFDVALKIFYTKITFCAFFGGKKLAFFLKFLARSYIFLSLLVRIFPRFLSRFQEFARFLAEFQNILHWEPSKLHQENI